MKKRGIIQISLGGWYQRTTLHLTEIYDFFASGVSKLPLNNSKLKEFWKRLEIKKVSREFGSLEVINVETKSGIKIKYFEDGLYILSIDSENVESSVKLLKDFYEKKMAPVINYLFSLGAPTPKILSNIKEHHPMLIKVLTNSPENVEINKLKFGEVYSKISFHGTCVYKTPNFIFIASPRVLDKNFDSLAEMQIFFREFKNQLKKYLQIHRKVWEEVDGVVEKNAVKGKEIGTKLSLLQSYQRTINLISFRINQMGTYADTRASLVEDLKLKEEFIKLFQYRFEDLINSLEYIKELWGATVDYVSSGVDALKSLEEEARSTDLESIKIIAGVGVVSVVLSYLTTEEYPSITSVGLISFVGFTLIAFLVTWVMRILNKNKKYDLEFSELVREI